MSTSFTFLPDSWKCESGEYKMPFTFEREYKSQRGSSSAQSKKSKSILNGCFLH